MGERRLSAREQATWRLGVSSTLKGIYVIRYALFSSGLGVLLAVLERSALGREPPIAGLLLGLVTGLFLFRGQLRPLSWPTLALGQTSLYLVQRKVALAIPWELVRSIGQDGRWVIVDLAQEIQTPRGETADQVRLEPRTLGTRPALLVALLSGQLAAPDRRHLPDDGRIRAELGLRAPTAARPTTG